jgi:nucleotide-binding universal stress UspA family protein
MDRVRKILAPTDFSDLSKVGIRYALEMARDTCAEVVVYHVIDFGEYWTNNPRNIPQYGNIFEDSRRLLDRFLAEHFADCIDLVEVRQVVEIGTPYKNIVDKAATEAVDMIVISTHGRTGIDHLILGSVAEKVVARAPCPVLVIPRQEREATTARAA